MTYRALHCSAEVDSLRPGGCRQLYLGDAETDGQGINLHNFAKYILTDGTGAEKRALISCLEHTIYLKDKEVVTRI